MAANMSLKKNEMPTQPADVRSANFNEVALGYSAEVAVNEAERCLNCKHMPCVNGCPVNIHIPDFISKIKESDFDKEKFDFEADDQPVEQSRHQQAHNPAPWSFPDRSAPYTGRKPDQGCHFRIC